MIFFYIIFNTDILTKEMNDVQFCKKKKKNNQIVIEMKEYIICNPWFVENFNTDISQTIHVETILIKP